MRLAVLKERAADETRVAATPLTVKQLLALGYEVTVEAGAGRASNFGDDSYTTAGARIGTRAEIWRAYVLLKVNAPSAAEIGYLRDGATLIGLEAALRHGSLEALQQATRAELAALKRPLRAAIQQQVGSVPLRTRRVMAGLQGL